MSLLTNQRFVLFTENTRKIHCQNEVLALLLCILGCVIFNMWGCAPQNPAQLNQSATADPPYQTPAADDRRQSSYERLQTIVNEREHDSFTPDFAIGPGDVLKISVPDVQELKERTERVSGEGMIELPIAGSIHVGSLTESQVKDAITKALSKYIKDPQVDLFITKYSSRQVAVTGMVNKPGLYTLNSRDDTIMEMIARAGGLSDQAGNSIIFIPSSGSDSRAYLQQITAAEEGTAPVNSLQVKSGRAAVTTAEHSERGGPERAIHNASVNLSNSGHLLPTGLPQGSDPIFINTADSREGQLTVPARPGDVIVVPARGEVLVAGWVQNAGAYQITPGMTALGAVTAAGGQMFSSSAEILRSGYQGEKVRLPVDLARVKNGQEPDTPVQSGDVVLVKPSAVGAVPYGAWLLFSKFGTGMYIPTF